MEAKAGSPDGAASAWPRAVVFDLDGTLADTAGDIAASLNHTLGHAGLAAVSVAQTIPMVGGGSQALLVKAFGSQGVALAGAALTALHDVFVEHYLGAGFPCSTVYPGVRALLASLRGDGVRLAVCTNKAETLSLKLLEKLDLLGAFDVISAGRPGRAQKPAPEPLWDVAAALGVPPQACIMVGDSAADISCARAAGIASIGVSFGYTAVPMAQLGAGAVIDDFADFAGACAALAPSGTRL